MLVSYWDRFSPRLRVVAMGYVCPLLLGCATCPLDLDPPRATSYLLVRLRVDRFICTTNLHGSSLKIKNMQGLKMHWFIPLKINREVHHIQPEL